MTTDYTLYTERHFSERTLGPSALPLPRAGQMFTMRVPGGKLTNGYRHAMSGITLLEVGKTYLIRLCEWNGAFTQCRDPGYNPGHPVVRLIQDDTLAAHPYYVAGGRVVIGWMDRGPELSASQIPESSRQAVLNCIEEPPQELLRRLHEQEDDPDPDRLFADMPNGNDCDFVVDVPFHQVTTPRVEELYDRMVAVGDHIGPEVQ